MSHTLKIGISDLSYFYNEALDVSEKLGAFGKDVTISKYQAGSDQYFNILTKELKNNHIDIAIVKLNDVPTTKFNEIVLAGLSKRKYPGESLIVRLSAIDPNMDFQLKTGTSISLANVRQRQQLAELRPDLVFNESYYDITGQNLSLENHHADAIMVANEDIDS